MMINLLILTSLLASSLQAACISTATGKLNTDMLILTIVYDSVNGYFSARCHSGHFGFKEGNFGLVQHYLQNHIWGMEYMSANSNNRLIGASDNSIKIYSIATNWATALTLQQDSTMNPDNHCALWQVGTELFLTGTHIGTIKKYDTTNPATMGAVTPYIMTSPLPGIVRRIYNRLVDQHKVYSHSGHPTIFHLDFTALAVTTSFTFASNIEAFEQHQHSANQVFVGTQDQVLRSLLLDGAANSVSATLALANTGAITNIKGLTTMRFIVVTNGRFVSSVDIDNWAVLSTYGTNFGDSFNANSVSRGMHLSAPSTLQFALARTDGGTQHYLEIFNLQLNACCPAGTYFFPTLNSCLLPANIPDFFGVDPADSTVKSCTVSNCRNCRLLNSFCMKCDQSANYFLRLSSNSCIQPATMASGEGANLANNYIYPCLQSLACLDCSRDYSKCSGCSVGWYLNAATGTCYQFGFFPAAHGLDATTHQIVQCSTPGCTDCQADASKCTKCDTSAPTKIECLGRINGRMFCSDTRDITEHHGCDRLTGTVKPCQAEGCKDCFENISYCSQCDDKMGYFRSASGCQSIHEQKLGLGLNPKTRELDKCKDPNCLLCRMDTDHCTACDDASGYHMHTDRCIKLGESRLLKAIKTSVYTVKRQIVVEFNERIDVTHLFSQNDIISATYTDKATGERLSTDLGTIVPAPGHNLRSIVFSLRTANLIVEGNFSAVARTSNNTMKLVRAEDSDLAPVALFPLEIVNATLVNSSTAEKAFDAVGKFIRTLSVSRIAITSSIIGSNKFLSVILDRLMCDISYLDIISPQNLTFTRSLFQLIQESSRNIELINNDKLQSLVSEPECEPMPSAISTKKIGCGLIYNYGNELLLIGIILLICAVMSYIGTKATSEKLKKYRKHFRVFGYRFFLVYMEANALELLFYSMLNIFKMKNGTGLWIGFAVSFLIVVYFAVLTILIYRRSSALDRSTGDLMEGFAGKKTSCLKEVRKAKQTSLIFLFFENLRFPFSSKVVPYHPFAQLLKYTALSVCLSLVHPFGQWLPVSAGIIEISYYYIITKATIRHELAENFIDQLNCLLHAAFCTLALLVHFSNGYNREIDLAALSVVLVKLALNIGMIVYLLFGVFISVIRLILKVCIRKKLKGNKVHFAKKALSDKESVKDLNLSGEDPVGKLPLSRFSTRREAAGLTPTGKTPISIIRPNSRKFISNRNIQMDSPRVYEQQENRSGISIQVIRTKQLPKKRYATNSSKFLMQSPTVKL